MMKVRDICRKFECREDIHYKTKPGPVAKNATPRPSCWESNPPPLDYYRPVVYHWATEAVVDSCNPEDADDIRISFTLLWLSSKQIQDMRANQLYKLNIENKSELKITNQCLRICTYMVRTYCTIEAFHWLLISSTCCTI